MLGIVTTNAKVNMFQTIAVLLGEDSISFENIRDFELFNAQEISIEPQRWFAKHIAKFCANRTEISEAEFITKLIKVADPIKLTAQFGLAILVPVELMQADTLAALKADVTMLAPRLEKSSSQISLDFARPDLPQMERQKLYNDIGEAVKGLRSEFGGKRVPLPIEIRTDDSLVARIEHVVLSRPDTPPEAFDDHLVGNVKCIDFGPPMSCELRGQKDHGSALKPPRRIDALIARGELVDEVFAIAKTREVATFILKRHEREGRDACVELLKVESRTRNISPLGPSE